MSDQQYKKTNKQRSYVEGNTVRNIDALPQRRIKEEHQREEQRKVDRQTKANQERELRMSLKSVLFLSFAVVLTLGVCAIYICLQVDNVNRKSHIATLESTILDLKTNNDATLNRIETSINIDDIKNIAINEMGMVYPTKEQIIYFTVDENDYMNQYQDIPEK